MALPVTPQVVDWPSVVANAIGIHKRAICTGPKAPAARTDELVGSLHEVFDHMGIQPDKIIDGRTLVPIGVLGKYIDRDHEPRFL